MINTLGMPTETVILFITLASLALFIDLFAHRKNQPISLSNAIYWSLFWFAIALLFGAFLWWHHGTEIASLFFTGYLLEQILSVDNLFVIMAIFGWFNIPPVYRHRVLYWGVLGAVFFRLVFVFIGSSLFALGAYVELAFGAAVGWTALMMLRQQQQTNQQEDYSQHLAYRLVQRIFPVLPYLQQHRFFIARAQLAPSEQHILQRHPRARWIATPLLLCLAVIELSDVMFAFDSVPAVIAVSREPLIVYSAMMFAVLGLRTLYLVLEALQNKLIYLEKAVVILLFFIAGKLLLSATDHFFQHGYQISPNLSLLAVLLILALGILASLFANKKR